MNLQKKFSNIITKILVANFFSISSLASLAADGDFSGEAAIEYWNFPEEPPPGEDQARKNLSVSLAPTYTYKISSAQTIRSQIFYRKDQADSRRTHFDIRELNWQIVNPEWEIQAGIAQEVWGVVESTNLTDTINQQDFIEEFDGSARLGQQMVKASIFGGEISQLDVFYLPISRKRVLPGEEGHFRTGTVVQLEQVEFESPKGNRRAEGALRLNLSLDNFELHLSYFDGMRRQPYIDSRFDEQGVPYRIPVYELEERTGIESEYVLNDFIFKFEGILSKNLRENYRAWVIGAEYNIVGFLSMRPDVTLYYERMRDTRMDRADNPFQDDDMKGIKISLNDAMNAEFYFVYFKDWKSPSKATQLKASRRILDNTKLSFESRKFIDIDIDDYIYSLNTDDYYKLTLKQYF